MKHSRLKRLLLPAIVTQFLAACATVPQDFEQVPSETWSRPLDTSLGKFFAEDAPADTTLSGVFLLDKPRDALRARIGLASLAEHTLDLQYYLWKNDITGRLLLLKALRAADRGVKVRILMDDIYHSGRDEGYAAIDAHPNVEVRLFNPLGHRKVGRKLNFLFDKRQLNNRMHNKIWLADGAAVVLGGRNIGDDYFGIDPKLNFRDLDVFAVGPAATEAGKAYDLYWNSKNAVPIEVLRKNPAGDTELQTFRTELERQIEADGAMPYVVPVTFADARENLEALREQLDWADTEIIVDPLERFAGGSESVFVQLGGRLTEKAQSEVVLQTAYLIPSQQSIENMAGLTGRGVRVRLLTNSLMSNNHVSVHAHYAKYRKPLLEAGTELHELRADAAMLEFLKTHDELAGSSHAGLHTKSAVVDGHTTLIGSFNMDPRSRDLNSEIGLLIYSEAFGEKVLQAMEEDFDPANSYRVTLNENGKLLWTGATETGPVEFSKEPGAPLWKRMLARLIRLIPIEGEL